MGKLIGAILGWFVGGPFVAIIGALIGHQFDAGLASIDHAPPKAQRPEVQRQFFETLFSLLGCLAKADGRVSEAEIKGTESLMGQLGLDGSQRDDAIGLFKQGAAADFSIDTAMTAFVSRCGRNVRLQQMLLELLVHLAYVDNELHPAERELIRKVAFWIGVRDRQFDDMMRMFAAQYSFSADHKATSHSIDDAYTALGIEASSTDAEVKRAYRKLMSKHHPDKLIAQGVPESMIKLANEKSAEISAAYDQIMAQRAK